MDCILAVDRQILDALLSIHNTFLDACMPVITRLGDHGFIWIVLGLALLATKKRRKFGAAVLLALTLGFLAGNCLLKPLVARVRPFDLWTDLPELLIPAPQDFAFPSGHTLSSFAAAGVLARMGRCWAVGSFVLAFLIACSRLYLLVHYPSDVLMGMVLGFLCAWVAVKIVKPEKV